MKEAGAKRCVVGAAAMQEVGKRLAKDLRAGDVVALVGSFGAGKTTLVQGLAAGLGIKETVDSPSFLSVKVYEGFLCLYHVDAYRLHAECPDADLYEEIMGGDGVCAVEWADRVADWLPAHTLWIHIEQDIGGKEQRWIALARPSQEKDDPFCTF